MAGLYEVTDVHILWAAGEAHRGRFREPVPLVQLSDASRPPDADRGFVTDWSLARNSAPGEAGARQPFDNDLAASSLGAEAEDAQ